MTVIVADVTDAAYVCVVVQTPAATATTCAADPSPQSIEHDRTSFEPGSVTFAEKLTLLDEDPAAGLVIVTDCATFATVSVAVCVTPGLIPSLATSVSVHDPSSVQVTLGARTDGFENVHVAPASTPAPGVAVHAYVSASPSGSVAVAVNGIAEPSLPLASET